MSAPGVGVSSETNAQYKIYNSICRFEKRIGISEKPLDLWSKTISVNGSIKRVDDELLNGEKVIEIIGKSQRSNSRDSIQTSINCPFELKDSLKIKLPILVLIIKNLKLEGKIEFQLTDSLNYQRRFIFITNTIREKIPKVTPTTAFFPLTLRDGWNIVELDLRYLCKEIYGVDFSTFERLILYPSIRIRRIYFQNRHYEHDETPKELYQALQELYSLKKNVKPEDKDCQTQKICTDKSINKVKKSKIKKKL